MSARVAVTPADSGAASINPDMGWVLHYYDNDMGNYGSRLAPSDTVDDFPGLSVVYLRLPWALLQPEEHRFDWSVVDTPAQRWTAKGKRVAFRFSACESQLRYATPEWVLQAGAKGNSFPAEGGRGVNPDGPYWEPDYDDPVFLARLDQFLAAAAARYDGSPEVAFIDVGSFGVWGEGHTFWSTTLPYSAETVIRHIDLYAKHFRRALIAANDDFASHGRGMACIEHAYARGLTLRDDSILVQPDGNAYLSAEIAQRFWPTRPVIVESDHYGPSRDRGYWQDGSKYLEAVEAYHASYASIHWWPREFLAENADLVRRINLRLGYRLQLTEASWPSRVLAGESFDIEAAWRNAGVAPCYPGGHPAYTLKDQQDGIVAVFVDEAFSLGDLSGAAPGEAPPARERLRAQLPLGLRPGRYRLFVSAGSRTGTPQLALPLEGDDRARRYLLGQMDVAS